MNSLSSLLVVAPTPLQDLAAQRAARLAAAHGARLRLFHPARSSPKAAAHDLAVLADEMADLHGLVDVDVVSAPWDALTALSAQHQLLVLGAAHGGWRGRRWRALTSHLARHAHCPLLMARRPPALPYATALVPVDLSHRTVPALRALGLVAADAQVHLMHMLGPDDTSLMRTVDVPEWVIRKYKAEQQAVAHTAMAQAHALAACLHRAPQMHVHPPTHLFETVLQLQVALRADLLVVGKRRSSAVADLMFDSFALKLATRAGADVLLLPPSCTAVASQVRAPAIRPGTPARAAESAPGGLA